MSHNKRKRLSWPPIIDRAREIVAEYDTLLTLRQLFYRLVAAEVIPNTAYCYKHLSSLTADARRKGTFPDLIDRGRVIHRAAAFDGPDDARDWLREIYRRDRTEGQPVNIYLALEKAALVNLLDSWFGDFGVSILALGGYASQTYVDQIRRAAEQDGRPAVLLYAGDYDPSGEDIIRDFAARSACFDKMVPVALTKDQVVEYDLPKQPGKVDDSRSAAFELRHGELVQVELDALPPDALRDRFATAIHEAGWDDATHQASLDQEAEDRDAL